jgi:predicted membrane protein
VNVGDAYLDLSAVDFTGHNETVHVSLGAGNLTVIVAPRVDVQANVQVSVGNADVFGQHWGGVGQSRHSVTDEGTDGPGGGNLTIEATVNVGNAEVRR